MTREPYKVKEVWAYIGVDPIGDEGVCAFQMPDGSWMPMVAADGLRLCLLRPMAEKMRAAGETVRLIHLSTRRDVTAAEEMLLVTEWAHQRTMNGNGTTLPATGSAPTGKDDPAEGE